MINDRLKFRAWDKEYKFMTPVMALFQDGNVQIYQPVQASEWGDVDWDTDIVPAERVEVMQWTGLYDAEGEMIWEGDIVRAFDNVNRISDPSLTEREPTYNHKAVKYMGGAFVLYCAKYDFCGVLGYNSATKPKTLTVVGNIHESPDLMERPNG